MEVPWTSEGLPKEGRADYLSVLLKELTISFIPHCELSDPGDEQRIEHTKNEGSNGGIQARRDEMSFHVGVLWITRGEAL